MPIAKPFFTYHRRLQRNAVDGTGITVWIVNIDHEKEEVGCSWRLPSHHYNYYGDRRFVDKYKHELAIGDNLKWQSKVELDIWINKLIYSSHQIYDSKFRFWSFIHICFLGHNVYVGLVIGYVLICWLPNCLGIQTVWFSRGFEDGCIFFETEVSVFLFCVFWPIIVIFLLCFSFL